MAVQGVWKASHHFKLPQHWVDTHVSQILQVLLKLVPYESDMDDINECHP